MGKQTIIGRMDFSLFSDKDLEILKLLLHVPNYVSATDHSF